jgi:hypothetical protein
MRKKCLAEMYILLLDNYLDNYRIGICANISSLAGRGIITKDDYYILAEDFSRRKPSILSKFYWNKNFINNIHEYWWSITPDGMKERKKYIQHIINKLT